MGFRIYIEWSLVWVQLFYFTSYALIKGVSALGKDSEKISEKSEDNWLQMA